MQPIDLYCFFAAQILSNLLHCRWGAALRDLHPGFSTKLSTDCVGDAMGQSNTASRLERACGKSQKLGHNRRLRHPSGEKFAVDHTSRRLAYLALDSLLRLGHGLDF